MFNCNQKVNTILLSSALLLSSLLPALAADSSTTTVQSGTVNKVRLGDRGGRERGRFIARAHEGRGGKGACGWHRHGMFSALKGQYALTDAQYEKLFSLKTSFMTELGPKFVALKADKAEMRNLMTEPNIDKTQVLSEQAKINGEKDQLANLFVNHKLDVLGVLTPEQRQQLRSHFVKRAIEGGGFVRG